jgi:glycosyltransferase involved in cell wall biosynthesis
MPAISVIMLTYNRETLVARAIESVLAQTFRDFEFIIVNNGSSDRSGAIAEEYAACDDRIRVIHLERGNIGSGRNAGLDAARGNWMAFIDDDDWCEPDFLAFLHGLATENGADVAICGATDKVFDEKRIMTAEEALIELMWRKWYNMAFPTKLFSRELAMKIRFPDIGKYDDISQMHRLLAFASRVVYHGLPKYTFYRHPGNNSAWTTAHRLLDAGTLDEYLRAYRTRTEWLSKRFPDNGAAWRYFEWSFMISMVEKITRLGLADCRVLRDAMTDALCEHREEFLDCGHTRKFEKKWMEKYIK